MQVIICREIKWGGDSVNYITGVSKLMLIEPGLLNKN